MVSRLRISFGLAIIAAVTLMLELVLMRAFDAMMNAEMSHLIITCAMFSFGVSGAYASLRPLPENADLDRYVGKLAAAFAVFSLLLLPLFNLNPLNFSALSKSPGEQAFYFALMYLTLMIPFFLSGLIFTTVFSGYASNIRTLYCFDLCGAAIGSVMFIPFIPLLGPGGLLFWAMALSLGAAVLFYGKLEGTQKLLLVAAVGAAVMPMSRSNGYFDFADHENKRHVMVAKQQDLLEHTRWDPVAKIEVINAEKGRKRREIKEEGRFKHVAYDGGEQSSRFYRFDGKFDQLRAKLERSPKAFAANFTNRSVAASHWLRADTNQDVLVIGSAGGQETKAALTYNARSVDAVEMVKAVVDLATNEYNDYLGGIFKDPRVHPHVGEGRTFLRGANKKYDIIQIFSNHTSSSMAAGAGRGVYLQTVEAYKEYFSGLKPDGILHINHHFYPRIITTAATAWRKMGRTDFRKHVIIYERRRIDTIPLILIKMSPWSKDEVSRLNTLMLKRGARRDRFRLAEDPIHPANSFLSADFYSGRMPPELVDRIPYRITAPTDDRPYFNFVRKHLRDEKVDKKKFVNASIAGMLSSKSESSIGVLHHLISGGVALVFALALILVPLFFRGKRGERWAGEFWSLSYFSCLGAAFIIVELTLAAVFMKLIGVPLYTYSVVIFTILAAAGIGSLAAKWLGITPHQRFWFPHVGTIVFGLLLLIIRPWVFDHFLASSLAVRLLVSGVMAFPISFFMGMCLPLGILAIEQKPRGAIAWAWGMNGLFTTIGGLTAAISSMFFGYRTTLVIALVIYGVAGLTFARLRKFAPPPSAAVEKAPESEDPVDASAMA